MPVSCQPPGRGPRHYSAHEKYTIFHALVFSAFVHVVLLYLLGSWLVQPASTLGIQPKSTIKLQVANFGKAQIQPVFSSTQADQQEKKALSDNLSAIESPSALSAPKRAPERALAIEPKQIPDAVRNESSVVKFALPVFAIAIEPNYPLHLLASGIRGSVSATFRFDRNGKIVDLEIVESRPAGAFDKSVIDALLASQLQQTGSQPSGRFQITVVFDPAGTNIEPQLSQH